MTVSLLRTDFEVYTRVVSKLPAHTQRQVDGLVMQAIGYVWGWQDASPTRRDDDATWSTDVSWDFGYHYGRLVAEMHAGWRSGHQAIQDEWRSFLWRRASKTNGGPVTKWHMMRPHDRAIAERTTFGNTCSACGTLLATEADFARHYVLPNLAYRNLGNCPIRWHAPMALDLASDTWW